MSSRHCLVCRRGADNRRIEVTTRTIGNRIVDLCRECSRDIFAVENVERRLLEQVAGKGRGE